MGVWLAGVVCWVSRNLFLWLSYDTSWVLELVVCTFVLGFSFGGGGCGVSDVDFLVGFVRCHNIVPSGGFWVAANGFFGLCGFRGGYGFGFRFCERGFVAWLVDAAVDVSLTFAGDCGAEDVGFLV